MTRNNEPTSTPTISILCPAYNVDKYLAECIESVIAQTFTDWELIIVDDGSTDSTPSICDEYGRKDPRIHVIHQTNQGLSGARNTALKVARGEFIAMIDTDDYAAPGWLEKLHSLIVENDADVSQVGFYREFKTFSRPKPLFKEDRVLTQPEIYIELLEDRKLPSYVWNKMFRRSAISSEFPVGKKFEDLYALSDWLKGVERLAVSGEILYHYRVRKGSILNSNFASGRFDYLKACIFRAEQAREFIPESFSNRDFIRFIAGGAMRAAKTIARFEKDPEVRLKYVRRISDMIRDFPVVRPEGINVKTWWRVQMLKNYPKGFIRLMRATYKLDLHSQMRINNQFD